MWVLFAFASAFFAGITSILAKCGIKKTDSDVATALRTIIVLLFAWIMVFAVGSQNTITGIRPRYIILLVLSGIATGASWLCYFKALQSGEINRVVPIDKSSTVLTIILAFLFLKESITPLKGAATLLIAAGTLLMVWKKNTHSSDISHGSSGGKRKSWLFYAIMSAVFAALTSILGKAGVEGVESNLGTAIRTGVVLVMAWLLVFARKKQSLLRSLDRKELVFIFLSGIATGASWLCYYRAMQDGLASVVVPIDKLSILITVAFSRIVFKEKLTRPALSGLVLITGGTMLMLL